MPYQLMPIPQSQDPLQSLAGLMQMGRQAQAWGDESKARKQQERFEAAFNTAKGDPIRAASLLEAQGDFLTARTVRDKADDIRRATVQQMYQRIDGQKTLHGQGAQLLAEIEAAPERYRDLRPRLMDLAAQVDPRLAQAIPEVYEPASVRQMLEFTTATIQTADTRQRGLKRIEEALSQTEKTVERTAKFRSALADWLSTSDSPEEWDAVKQHGASLGIPAALVNEFGDFSKDSKEAARRAAMTPSERGTETRAKVDDTRADNAAIESKRHNQVMESIGRQREARLTASERQQVTLVTRAKAESKKSEDLDKLARDLNDPYSSLGAMKWQDKPKELERRQLLIENEYRTTIGLQPHTYLPAAWGSTQPAEPPAPAPTPPLATGKGGTPTAADFTITAGQNGRVIVTAPDGTKAEFGSRDEATEKINAFLSALTP